MKKYYMSMIDFSEVVNVTTDQEQLEKAGERMKELGLTTEKGNPSPKQIKELVTATSPAFFDKLRVRLARRRKGIEGAYGTFAKMYETEDYYGMFFYMAFLYGFVGWQVPEGISLMPTKADTLKIYMCEFIEVFADYLSALINEEAGAADGAENM